MKNEFTSSSFILFISFTFTRSLGKFFHMYAVVAGGSKGIGYAISLALAKRGYNLILIARGEERLQLVKKELEDKFGIAVFTISKDLSMPQTAEEISRICIEKNFTINVFCHVAGIGGAKDYLDVPLSESRYMIHLNLESPVALINIMLPLLEKNQPAFILNVASMAGLAPIPVKNIYSATKSAMIFFSRALREQVDSRNISVSCLCPGPVYTKPEIEKDTKEKLGWYGNLMAVNPERVGEIAVKGMLKKRFMIIPGVMTKISAFFIKLLPEKILVGIYERMIESGKKKNKTTT